MAFSVGGSSGNCETAIDAIRAAGDPASIAELKQEPIPDEQNASAIFLQIAPRLLEFRKADAAFSETPIGKQYEAEDTIPTVEQAAAMQSTLSQFADVDSALTRAAQCDEYAPILDYSADSARFVDEVLEHQQPIRIHSKVLSIFRWRSTLGNGTRRWGSETGGFNCCGSRACMKKSRR